MRRMSLFRLNRWPKCNNINNLNFIWRTVDREATSVIVINLLPGVCRTPEQEKQSETKVNISLLRRDWPTS